MNSTTTASASVAAAPETTAPPVPSAAMNDARNQTHVFPLPSTKREPFGTVGTADMPEQSELAPLTDCHIAALSGRGLDIELMVKLGVGASQKLGGDAIGIPYFDDEVRVGCKHRTLTGDKRFAQDIGSRQIFWNVNCLRDETLKDHPLVITEGELDALAALQAGFPKTVSVPGGAPLESLKDDAGKKYGFLREAEALLDECSVIILATDGDGPGANLRHDLAVRLGAHRCKWVQYPKGCKDLNDALRMYGERGVQATLQRAQPLQIEGYFELDELPPLDPPRAYETGIVGLSEHYKLRLSDFTALTGVPGHGKSSFSNEIACRMAEKHGWRTVFASFEQIAQTDHRRALRTFHAKKLEKLMTSDEIAKADAWIRQHFGFIVPGDDDDVTLEWLLGVLKQAVLRKEAQLVIVDPWNEMDHTRPPDMTLTEYTGFAIKQFKKFARKYRVHLIVVAHPTKMKRDKDGKYPVPSLYDISDSAHWANKPDVGIVIHRPDLSVNETTIKVAKARYHAIGIPGEIRGAWNAEQARYTIIHDGSAYNAAA
jgi:twinkle protein